VAHVKEHLQPGAWERILGAVRSPVVEGSADESPLRDSLASKEAAK